MSIGVSYIPGACASLLLLFLYCGTSRLVHFILYCVRVWNLDRLDSGDRDIVDRVGQGIGLDQTHGYRYGTLLFRP